MTQDELYMLRCLEIAEQGLGLVAPNPMVGAVIVHNGKIIGEGYHEKYGENHAEVNAINSVKNKYLLKESTIYVSLEPCSHFGKTPPCSNLIIENKIPNVVVGCIDTFSEVSGKGIEKLKNAGVNVKIGVLESQARHLNRRFFKFHEKKKAYAILKWAQTKDGFIDQKRDSNHPRINWITQPETQSLVHKWRTEEQAILVGKQTVLNDNPSLTVRSWTGKNPTRIIIDPSDSLYDNREQFNIFNQDAPTFILNRKQNREEGLNRWIKTEDLSPESILNELYKLDIQSVIIEGGSFTLHQFITQNAWDEARILTGNKSFESGLKAPVINQKPSSEHRLGLDHLSILYK